MANLFLDRAGAEGVVSSINTQIENLRDAASAINDAVVSQMPEYWRGTAHDKAENTYVESYQNFLMEKVPAMVEELNKFMNDCVTEIANVDAQLGG